MKLFVFTTGNAEYEIEGLNEADARLSLRDIIGIDLEEDAELIDVEFYSDGDDFYEDGIRRGDEEYQ